MPRRLPGICGFEIRTAELSKRNFGWWCVVCEQATQPDGERIGGWGSRLVRSTSQVLVVWPMIPLPRPWVVVNGKCTGVQGVRLMVIRGRFFSSVLFDKLRIGSPR